MTLCMEPMTEITPAATLSVTRQQVAIFATTSDTRAQGFAQLTFIAWGTGERGLILCQRQRHKLQEILDLYEQSLLRSAAAFIECIRELVDNKILICSEFLDPDLPTEIMLLEPGSYEVARDAYRANRD